MLRLGWISQYHGCWCLVSLRGQVICSDDIDCVDSLCIHIISRALWRRCDDSHGVRASGADRRQKYTHSQHQWWETWWRHQMETFSALLAICAGNSPVPVNSPHKGQWRGALMFSFIWVWINCSVNNRDAGNLRRYRAHYDVPVMNSSEKNNVNMDW